MVCRATPTLCLNPLFRNLILSPSSSVVCYFVLHSAWTSTCAISRCEQARLFSGVRGHESDYMLVCVGSRFQWWEKLFFFFSKLSLAEVEEHVALLRQLNFYISFKWCNVPTKDTAGSYMLYLNGRNKDLMAKCLVLRWGTVGAPAVCTQFQPRSFQCPTSWAASLAATGSHTSPA